MPSIRAKPLRRTTVDPVQIPTLSTQCMAMSTTDFLETINIFTQFGDLSPSQMLTLFTQFINWPGYQGSSFHPSMENSLIKMETSNESIIEDNAFEDEVELLPKVTDEDKS